MLYAVLDWDNTIRRGFTLFDWMEFLYSERILDRRVNHEIEDIQMQYAEKRINHDTYARMACLVYAKAMNGISMELRDNLVRKYIRKDERQLQPFAHGLFHYLNQHKIKPIIISGAPEYILEQYKDKFDLHRIYAFSEGYLHGFCNGKVKYNYGSNKMRTVKLLCEQYGNRPIIGFGDSSSDIPLFQKSDYAFCIVKHNVYSVGEYEKKIIYVSDATNNNQIKILLERSIKPKDKPIRYNVKDIRLKKIHKRENNRRIRYRSVLVDE